jgi:hypothetical protein
MLAAGTPPKNGSASAIVVGGATGMAPAVVAANGSAAESGVAGGAIDGAAMGVGCLAVSGVPPPNAGRLGTTVGANGAAVTRWLGVAGRKNGRAAGGALPGPANGRGPRRARGDFVSSVF